MRMMEMGESERPREKMIAKGPGALSNGELLAVILRSGSREENAADLARRLLSQCGGMLTGLFSMPAEKMAGIKGMGPCKIASVQAALELGRRFYEEGSSLDHRPVTTAGMIYDILRPSFKGLLHEECWAVYLNNSNYVLEKRRITTGSSDQTTIDVRGIVRAALDKGASSVILAHNHPSGNPRPSRADIEFTERLHDAVEAFNIKLLDHVVVCDDCYYSFSDDGMHYRGEK